MNTKLKLTIVLVSGFILVCAVTSAVDNQAPTTALDLIEQHAESVVWVDGRVRTIISTKAMNVPPQEQTFEVIGTIIDPSGLTVVSNSSIDVGSLLRRVRMYNPDGQLVHPDVKSEFSAVRLHLADGTEVPAKILLRDAALDLAFVLPDTKSGVRSKLACEYAALKSTNVARVELLDEIVMIGRLGEHLDRQPAIYLGRISAIVKNPQLVYVASADIIAGRFGIPVFTKEGSVLGIQLARKTPIQASMVNSMISPNNLCPVILPIDDIYKIAKQAIKHKDATDNVIRN